MKQLKTIVQLRRKNINEYNNDEVFRRGEVLFVDSFDEGLRIKVADGETKFADLDFLDDINYIIIRGYFYENNFYKDSAHRKKIKPSKIKIYIDNTNNRVYLYDGTDFHVVNEVPLADPNTPGILKLYGSLGFNKDGTCDQNTITTEVNKKVGANLEDDVLLLKK